MSNPLQACLQYPSSLAIRLCQWLNIIQASCLATSNNHLALRASITTSSANSIDFKHNAGHNEKKMLKISSWDLLQTGDKEPSVHIWYSLPILIKKHTLSLLNKCSYPAARLMVIPALAGMITLGIVKRAPAINSWKKLAISWPTSAKITLRKCRQTPEKAWPQLYKLLSSL